ncbi:hypothetical protein Ocin01_02257 [Orchesella cincta]|uniref:Uncharacterized protein n=1 Tax=Orchesella cincta TaxID=48709 RepID=A0A1D2NGM9_ORCCI|nr:hypothetical protein Ocin01_02257 [Orchesella cincta]
MLAVKGIVEAFDAPIVPALSSPFVAPSRSSSTKGTQEAASESSQTKPPLQPQLVENADKDNEGRFILIIIEDLEKLISGGDAEGTRKEDLASTPEKQEAQPLKPATKERKSSEKEVKFKLPPEELEDDEEDLEEEVEIVRPPTPPKTLSKSKPKSPEPTPEPTVNVPTSSSHRDHDELLISSMQTTVTGTGAPGITADNKSCSAGPDTTTTYNIASNVTTPNTISPTPPPPPQKLDNKSQSENIVEQSAAAAIAAAKAAGSSSPSPSERVSVIGIEETASLISGERWDNRTPTPTFRQQTPPVPHRPPTPPEKIPSIYLEGPMTVKGQEIIVREAQIEVEGGEDYDLDDEYEPSAPVVLSGKVTLSVISSAAGGPLSPDEVTDAPSLSLDDRAQAENSRGSSRRNLAAAISSAMNEEVKGKTDGKKSSNASSPDMDEYEVIGKGGFECEEDEAVDVSLDDYLTATDAELDAEKAHEDTAADISTIDDLKQDPLPQDEE